MFSSTDQGGGKRRGAAPCAAPGAEGAWWHKILTRVPGLS